MFGNCTGQKVFDVVPAIGANDDQIDTEFSSRLRNDLFRLALAYFIVDLNILDMQVANFKTSSLRVIPWRFAGTSLLGRQN